MVSAPYDLNRCCDPDAPTAARVRVRTASSLSQPLPVNKACIRAGGTPGLDALSLPSPQVQYPFNARARRVCRPAPVDNDALEQVHGKYV